MPVRTDGRLLQPRMARAWTLSLRCWPTPILPPTLPRYFAPLLPLHPSCALPTPLSFLPAFKTLFSPVDFLLQDSSLIFSIPLFSVSSWQPFAARSSLLVRVARLPSTPLTSSRRSSPSPACLVCSRLGSFRFFHFSEVSILPLNSTYSCFICSRQYSRRRRRLLLTQPSTQVGLSARVIVSLPVLVAGLVLYVCALTLCLTLISIGLTLPFGSHMTLFNLSTACSP